METTGSIDGTVGGMNYIPVTIRARRWDSTGNSPTVPIPVEATAFTVSRDQLYRIDLVGYLQDFNGEFYLGLVKKDTATGNWSLASSAGRIEDTATDFWEVKPPSVLTEATTANEAQTGHAFSFKIKSEANGGRAASQVILLYTSQVTVDTTTFIHQATLILNIVG